MADVRKAAIVKDAILWDSSSPAVAAFVTRADLDFDACWRLVVAPILRLDCRRRVGPAFPLAPGASWLLLAPPPFLLLTHPQGLTLPPLYCSLVTFSLSRLLSVEISRRQGKAAAGSIIRRCKAVKHLDGRLSEQHQPYALN